uniref:Si:ch211-286o17.1 n=1 Tax=Gadus morhua TaxID=8049 RepID=A0A8C5BHF4_GADMO
MFSLFPASVSLNQQCVGGMITQLVALLCWLSNVVDSITKRPNLFLSQPATLKRLLGAKAGTEESRTKIASVLQQLCGEDCKLDLYQEQGSTQVLVSGQYVEGQSDCFLIIDVEEASPRVVKGSKMVLVSLLISGLLLAALLVAGYYFKTHRKSSKGVRLAESFQVDEENQANTLVSVAPLPQDPLLEKPAATTNGAEPLPENPAPPATNGHAPNQTPVADTEM